MIDLNARISLTARNMRSMRTHFAAALDRTIRKVLEREGRGLREVQRTEQN